MACPNCESMREAFEYMREKLRINRKIRAYVAFVLTGNETADVQLAADDVKTQLEWRNQRLAAFRTWAKTLPEPYQTEFWNILANGRFKP